MTQDAPRAPGIYGPAPEFTTAGIYDLTLIVHSPQARDSITVPNLRVYARAEDAPRERSAGHGGGSTERNDREAGRFGRARSRAFSALRACEGTLSGRGHGALPMSS